MTLTTETPVNFKINALCLGREPSDPEDNNVEGIYAITFNVETTGLPACKLASMALDIFHSHIPVLTMDDFEFTALGENDEPIGEDENHIAVSAQKSGTVKKINDVPYPLYGDDKNLTPEDLSCKYNAIGDGNHPKFSRGWWRVEVNRDNTIIGYWVWVKHMLVKNADTPVIKPLAPVGAGATESEYFPGATRAEIGEVMMQDVVGDYEKPDQVPEWGWVERAASFNHARNGIDGIWEFVLNLSRTFDEEIVPEKLQPILAEARSKNLSYLIFHQGT